MKVDKEQLLNKQLFSIYLSLADNYNVPITSGPMMELSTLMNTKPCTEDESKDLDKLLSKEKISESSVNNGGKTSYYDLPLPDVSVIDNLLHELLEGRLTITATIKAIKELCPQTLNDLIEYKDMKPWQHEVMKACYAINERAEKNGGSELRELNKIVYYTNRRIVRITK